MPPLFWDSANESVVELKEGGTFVGQFHDAKYIQGERNFANGDSLFAFTDGSSLSICSSVKAIF